MGKQEELDKARERGHEMTETEAALEDARDAFQADPSNEANRALFKQRQREVVAARRADREAREAAGPPAGASNVVRTPDGRAIGWNEGGDVAVAPGGVA